jgi:hypothetical protein
MSQDTTTVMFAGVGALGGQVLDLFLRCNGPIRAIAAGRDIEVLRRRANTAALVALQLGYDPDIEVVALPLDDADACAETISHCNPDLIFAAMSAQSWWVIGELPQAAFARLDRARIGPWLPVHLAPIYALMRAVALLDSPIPVINAAYPDVVNPALAGVGLAPLIGIGNVANPVPALRAACARRLGVSVGEVVVKLVAHHFVSNRVSRHGNSGGAPFALGAEVGGLDVSNEFDPAEVLADLPARFKRLGGREGQIMTAASALTVIEAYLAKDRRLIHAPAPHGQPGGYPVRIGTDGLELDLPAGVTVTSAIDINQRGAHFDGIEAIDRHGTVSFMEENMEIMHTELGYFAASLTPCEAADRSAELIARYREFAARQQGRVELAGVGS